MNLAPLMDLHEFLRTCKTKMMKDIKVDSEIIYFINYNDICLYATIYNDGENLICTIWDSVGTYQFIEFKQRDINNFNKFYNEIDNHIYHKIYDYLYEEIKKGEN